MEVSPAVRAYLSRIGKLAKGKPKHFSEAELKRRAERLAEARKHITSRSIAQRAKTWSLRHRHGQHAQVRLSRLL